MSYYYTELWSTYGSGQNKVYVVLTKYCCLHRVFLYTQLPVHTGVASDVKLKCPCTSVNQQPSREINYYNKAL